MAITNIYKGDVERSDIQKIYKGAMLLYERVTPSVLFYGGGSPSTVIKANSDNLSTLNTSVSYGGTIRAVAVDDTHIYVGGSSTNRVRKYLKSNLTYIGETPYYGGEISVIAIG